GARRRAVEGREADTEDQSHHDRQTQVDSRHGGSLTSPAGATSWRCSQLPANLVLRRTHSASRAASASAQSTTAPNVGAEPEGATSGPTVPSFAATAVFAGAACAEPAARSTDSPPETGRRDSLAERREARVSVPSSAGQVPGSLQRPAAPAAPPR